MLGRLMRAIAILVVTCDSIGLLVPAAGADPTLAEVVEGVRQWQENVNSAYYKMSFEAVPEVSNSAALAATGKVFLKRGDEEFALKDGRRWLARKSEIFAVAKSAQKDKGRVHEEVRAFDGKVFVEQGELVGSILSRKDIPKNCFQSMLLTNISFVPAGETASDDVNELMLDFTLPTTLERNAYVTSVENVDGQRLVRLDGDFPGPNKVAVSNSFWLDPSLGYAMVQREIYDRDGDITIRFVNSKFQEVVDGVFLPYLSLCEEFGNSKNQSPVLTNKIVVAEWKINDVSDELFELDLRPGTQVSDFYRGTLEKPLRYTIPLDASKLDSVIRRASGKSPYMLYLASGALLIGGAILVVRYAKRRSLR